MFAHVAPLVLLTILAGGPAFAQIAPSRCADCHLAAAAPPAPAHLADWERSPHGRNQVGCEKCHGGNPDTFESFMAHQGVLNSRNPASPVHTRNLVSTCGTCHPGPFVAFQKSHHYELLGNLADGAPSCVTCHEQVAARLLSPKALERQCNRCHGDGRMAPRAGRAASGRRLLEEIEEVRASLTATRRLLDRMPRDARHAQFEESWQQAEVPLVQAVHDAHAFVFDSAMERVTVARQRVDALMLSIATR